MKPLTQSITRGTFEEAGANCGNCLQATLASILEVPLAKVPHAAAWPGEDWYEQLNGWLEREHGLSLIACPVDGWTPPRVYHVISGRDAITGTPHACVGLGGELVWDPHPLKPGLSTPHRLWWFFAAVDPAAASRERP